MDTHCQYHEANREIGVMFTSQSRIFHGIFHGLSDYPRESLIFSHFPRFSVDSPRDSWGFRHKNSPLNQGHPVGDKATPGPMGIPCSSAIHMVEPAVRKREID